MATMFWHSQGLSKSPDCHSKYKYFSGQTSTRISYAQAKIAYILTWKQ